MRADDNKTNEILIIPLSLCLLLLFVKSGILLTFEFFKKNTKICMENAAGGLSTNIPHTKPLFFPEIQTAIKTYAWTPKLCLFTIFRHTFLTGIFFVSRQFL